MVSGKINLVKGKLHSFQLFQKKKQNEIKSALVDILSHCQVDPILCAYLLVMNHPFVALPGEFLETERRRSSGVPSHSQFHVYRHSVLAQMQKAQLMEARLLRMGVGVPV